MVQTLFDSVENAGLVECKLHRLEHHLAISGRILNDLRRLRGMLRMTLANRRVTVSSPTPRI